jgi:hypothetical protein
MVVSNPESGAGTFFKADPGEDICCLCGVNKIESKKMSQDLAKIIMDVVIRNAAEQDAALIKIQRCLMNTDT